jgi:hypothetical protein
VSNVQTQTWEEYCAKVETIRQAHPNQAANLLFRGQSDSEWKLTTTLERRTTQSFSFLDYYRSALRIQVEIETESGIKWRLPSFNRISSWVKCYDQTHYSSILAYEYLAHLRHNGFPSPLLDWSRSPFVAAYFAFCGAKADNVAIYIYLESPHGTKVGGDGVPAIRRLGPYVGTHKRHFRQQSTYTLRASFEKDDFDGSYSWRFVNHEMVFESTPPTRQDLLWKIIIPVSERRKVLRLLDEFNLNTFHYLVPKKAIWRLWRFERLTLSNPVDPVDDRSSPPLVTISDLMQLERVAAPERARR